MDDLFAALEGMPGLAALAIVVVVVFLLLKLIIYILLHYTYSRILSLITGIAFIVIYTVGFFSGSMGGSLLLFPLLWIQYLAFIGPSIFDEYWDGTVTITFYFDRDEMEIKENYIKEFAIHTALVLFFGLPFFLWGAEVPFIPIIPSAILLIVTIIGFVRHLFDE